jgi:hypothetical protein
VRGGAFARVSLTVLGRAAVIVLCVLFAVFFLMMVFALGYMTWHDPLIALTSLTIVTVIALVARHFSRHDRPSPPDHPTSGAGVPVVPRPPVIEGEAEEAIPRAVTC